MKRQSIALALSLACCVLGLPIAAEGQQPGKVYRIGVLCPTQCVPTNPVFQPWMQGFRDFGWVEGQNISFDFRHALGQSEQMARLAADLVSAKPDVLVAPSHSAAWVLKRATQTIPIVFVGVGDPVQSGFVESLARPGGNMTGLTVTAGPDVPAKQLELLSRAVPTASRIGVLFDPPNNVRVFSDLEAAARSLGVQLVRLDTRQADDLEPAVATAVKNGAGALLVLSSPLMTAQAARIGEAAIRHRLPAMTYTELIATGYVLSYGPSYAHIYRRSGYYVDKVLRGAKPGDLPVEQPTTYRLVVDLRTAAAIGVKIPQSVMILAEKIIE